MNHQSVYNPEIAQATPGCGVKTVPDVYTAVVLSILPLAISFKRKRVLHQTNDLVLKLNGSLAFITDGAYDFRSGFHLRIIIILNLK